MSEQIGNFLTAIGAIILGGGTVTALAFGLFKLFSEQWLNSKFQERLAAFKHDQQKEIERLRFEINKLMDRTTKLHQREFEILPKAWALLGKSFHTVRSVTSAFQSYPDLSRMSQAQFDEFLQGTPLKKWQQEELKGAPDRNEYYQDAIFWHRLNIARKANRKSAIFLLRNGIFMLPELKEKFDSIDKLCFGVLIEHEMNKAHNLVPRQRTEQEKFSKEGESLLKSVEEDVQKRLWSSEEA